MDPLRVLLTNVTLASYTGTELYQFDLARRLLRLGHQPVVYTPEPGDIAERLRLATVPVVNDLAALGSWVPDVMHCHHTFETILALLHFPTTPAVYVCHDGLVWFDEAPPHPRIVRHVAVDANCRDRLELVHGVPAEQIRLIPNWVDLGRFRPRPPLPAQPERAVVFSNQARMDTHLGPIKEACDRLGLPLDVIGSGTGTGTTRPEDLLGRYDLVFAKAKAALEAMAVGAAVVLCDARGLGPMVTSPEFDRLRHLNFGARSLEGRIEADAVAAEIKRYDAADATLVSSRVRAEAGLEPAVDRLVAVYREAIEEGARLAPDPVREGRVLATFLGPVSLRLRQADGERAWLRELEAARAAWEAARHESDAERQRVEAYLIELDAERQRVEEAYMIELDGLRAQAEAYQLELSEARRQLESERTTPTPCAVSWRPCTPRGRSGSAPASWGSRLWAGASGSPSGSSGGDRAIRVALVGAGAMGRRHARALHQCRGARLAVVVDRHSDRAQRVAIATGCGATDRLEDALACDAAIIATPADQHVDAALAFLRAGKPVLVEKPAAETLEEVRRLVEASERSGVPLMCGFVERFNPAVVTAATLLPETPRHMVAERHSPPVARIQTDVILDLLIHDVDLAIHFMAGAGIDQVRPQAEAATPSSDAAGCHLGFAGGATARLSASRAHLDRVRRFVIETASARYELDLARPGVFVHVRGAPPTEIPVPAHEEPLACQLQHFLALIDGRADAALERARLLEPHRVAAQLVGA